jgi:site-specific DNA-methyltransferase (cytosine-N4-specific)
MIDVIENNKKRILRQDFDFSKYMASYKRHAIHQYPAMLHYKLVESLIKEYNPNIVYDPYSGSGVSIVESLKQNKKVYGSDINPLALLIADVRSSNFDIKNLIDLKDKLIKDFSNLKEDIPEVNNMDFWFKENVIKDLGKLRSFIKNIENEKMKKFFLVVFSQTVRSTSNNKKGEFKRFRIKDLESYNPDVLNKFNKLFDNYISFLEPLTNNNYCLFKQDTREEINLSGIDLIITSPPYGDSKTTVAYGQFSSFALDWIKGINPYGDETLKIDSKMLGGKKKKEIKELPSKNFNNIFEKIQKEDEKRAKEVYSFFDDLYESCKNLVKTLNKNAHVIFIVGNRRVKGYEIPMDFIIVDFFEHLGLELKHIYVRKISNKRMPSKNSPTNKAGKKSNTMLNEYIVILKN